MKENDDAIPGCVPAIIISGILWVLIFGGLALVLSRVLR